VPVIGNQPYISEKLVYPASVSHQLATLSQDQHRFLLQQQTELVNVLAATDQFVHQHQQQQQQQQQQHNRFYFNNTNNNNNNNQLVPFQNSNTFQQFNMQPNSFIRNANMFNPYQNNQYNYLNNNYQQQIPDLTYQFNNNNNNNNNIQTIKQPYRQHRRTVPANELHVNIEECIHQFKSLETERKKIEMELSYLNLNNKNQNNNNNNLTFVASPQLMPVLRITPNSSRVDRLLVDFLKEHTKTNLLLNRIENLNGTLFLSNMQATLAKWLARIQNVQAKRNEEIINNTNRQRLIGLMGQNQSGLINNNNNNNRSSVGISDDKDVVQLAQAVSYLAQMTRKSRTALWCSWQISFFHYYSNENNITNNDDTNLFQINLKI